MNFLTCNQYQLHGALALQEVSIKRRAPRPDLNPAMRVFRPALRATGVADKYDERISQLGLAAEDEGGALSSTQEQFFTHILKTAAIHIE